VAILVLLAILSTMGLAFIYKVGLMSSVTLNRRTSMQAHYLAESAANHALWCMLNDPEFAPEFNKYYMHSLGDRRYGYKVRMPTETTFATVATVGAMGDIATQQSYVQYIIPSNVLTAYARKTTPTIQYRRLIGAHWTDPADTPNIPIPTVYWVEMEGCPVRKEIIMGSIDGPDDINFVVWDGTSWGNPHAFGQDANKNYKCFDIAYENQSGRALVVGRTDGTATVRYNVWDGTAWLHATAQPAFNLAGGAARLVVMASCPGNDQILIATVNSLFDLQLFLWNGSVFTDLGVLETSTYSDQPGTVQIVYEQQSGDALVIWTIWSATPKFRVWNGVTLGAENIVPIFPDNVYFLRAAGDPTSDHIVVAGVDKFYDVQVGIWDGTAWPDSREVETDNANQVRQGVDVAWETTGEDALVVWVPWSSGSPIVRSLAWKKGTALADSTVEPGPDVQNQPWLVRLLPISQSEKIILLVETNTNDLRYSLWDGERLKGDPGILLESDISVQNELAFDLAEAHVPKTGGTGTGSGGGGNLAPVVDAGPDQTLIFPTMETSLDGTVTDDGLPNPPAAVTTTWTLVSGPGTVVFGDGSQEDTKIQVSDIGTYVFRLTADDGERASFDEVTIEVEPPKTMYTGTYSGNGMDNRSITGLGFQPDVVIIKSDDSEVAVIRTSTMSGDASKVMEGGDALKSNMIQSLDSDGFTVGSDKSVNGSGKNIYFAAFKAVPGEMKIGSYTGDGSSDRIISGMGGFQPKLIIVMPESKEEVVHRSPSSNASFNFDNGGALYNCLTTPVPFDGFRVGSDKRVNESGKIFHYVCWPDIEGQQKFSGYWGDAVDGREITGLGFEPEYVIIRCVNSGEDSVQRMASIDSALDETMYFKSGSNASNRIQVLQADGFQIGSDNDVNRSGKYFAYFAWGSK
jgi:hypothetical protein